MRPAAPAALYCLDLLCAGVLSRPLETVGPACAGCFSRLDVLLMGAGGNLLGGRATLEPGLVGIRDLPLVLPATSPVLAEVWLDASVLVLAAAYRLLTEFPLVPAALGAGGSVDWRGLTWVTAGARPADACLTGGTRERFCSALGRSCQRVKGPSLLCPSRPFLLRGRATGGSDGVSSGSAPESDQISDMLLT